MLITDVKAHHIRIPFDAGVASFRQGASAIAALDMVIVEVSTDAGLTGWGDAFAYVCPRTTMTAIEEMIAPQWPHMKRSMATVLAELDYRQSAWTEHETIAAHILSGNAKAAEGAALAHAISAGRMTEERLKGTDQAA